MLWGPLSRLGLVTAALTALADQILKLWLIYIFELGGKSPVRLTPFLDLVLVWNRGISFGQLQQDGPLGQGILLAVKAAAVVLLWIWLARTDSRLTTISLGLIIGGAIGNAIDWFLHAAVADFVLLHITTQTLNFTWYVFNLADVAICAGVAGLLYESLLGGSAAKAP